MNGRVGKELRQGIITKRRNSTGIRLKKEFLENAAMIFDRHRPDITEKAQQRKIEELETKLKKKDEVIAEIAEENMMIKKLLVAGARERKGQP